MLSIVEHTRPNHDPQKTEPLLSNDHSNYCTDDSSVNAEASTKKSSLLLPPDIDTHSTSQDGTKLGYFVDHTMTTVCTCCNCQKLKEFRKRRPLCSYFLLYTILTFVLAAIGGVIFHKCEYEHESNEIGQKIALYNRVRAALPVNMRDDLEELLSLCGVPLQHTDNRWRLSTATFFAFTTASTIGYGYTTPQTFWGRFATFLYGLPAICVFGLAMVQIGSAVAKQVEKRIQRNIVVRNKWNAYQRFVGWLSIEVRRMIYVLTLLIILIMISGAIFAHIQEDWTMTDGVYFMWISISTIGYGDLHPDVIETTLWANVIIWVGLAMTALLIGAVQDYGSKKLKRWRLEQVDSRSVSVDDTHHGSADETEPQQSEPIHKTEYHVADPNKLHLAEK